jgi:hypothetical protein
MSIEERLLVEKWQHIPPSELDGCHARCPVRLNLLWGREANRLIGIDMKVDEL